MLKYVETKVTFSEVPDEISLCINISNCPCYCKGCHSSYLAEDKGEILTIDALDKLIKNNKGVTCVAFMGGDNDPKEVSDLAGYVMYKQHLKTCWYSGRQYLSPNIDLDNFEYIKTGSYIEENGPLSSPKTNQRFYKVNRILAKLEDITYKFIKKEI